MRSLFLVWVVLAILLPTDAQAMLDYVRHRLLEQYTLSLRWENVKGTPYLLSGECPEFNPFGISRVQFDPGEKMLIDLPAGEMLRVHCDEQVLAPEDFFFSLSYGRGVAAGLVPACSKDGHDLLVAPGVFERTLIHLARPDTVQGGLKVSLFVSRQRGPASVIWSCR
jgi:hypothetical protein